MFKDLKEKPLILWGVMVILLLMLVDIFFIKAASDIYYFILCISWFWVNKFGKISSKFSLIIGIGGLFICPFLMLFSNAIAEKIAIWAFLLLLSSVLLRLLEVKNNLEEN